MGVQIPTSVTIINSLHGFFGLSITNPTTSAVSAIGSGSVVEVAGSFFRFESEEAINASSWTAITTSTTAYLALTPSGSAGSQTLAAAWTSTAPTWRDDKYGWYASAGSSTRVVGSCYKAGTSSYGIKTLYVKGQDTIFIKKIEIGVWNMDSTNSVIVHYDSMQNNKLLSVSASIFNDGNVGVYDLVTANGYFLATELSPGTIQVDLANSNLTLARIVDEFFDGGGYSATDQNRGHVIITYQA